MERKGIENFLEIIFENVEKIAEKFEMEDVFFYSVERSLKRMDLRYYNSREKIISSNKNLYIDLCNYLGEVGNGNFVYEKSTKFTEMFDLHELEEYCIFPILSNSEKSEIPLGVIIYGNRSCKNKVEAIKDRKEEFIKNHEEIVKLCLQVEEKNRMNNEFKKMLSFIVKIGKIKEAYNVEHQYNVAIIAEKIAIEMGLSVNEIISVKISAMVHDCGKMMIDSDIFKNKKLTEDEVEIIKKHTIYGEKIVKEFFGRFDYGIYVGKIIRHHHENYDGSGYPDAIDGDKIPLESAIIRVADSIEAMLGKRHYKDKMILKDVNKEIKKYSGVYYNPKVAENALRILKNDELYNIDLKKNDIIVNAEIKKGENIEFIMGFLRFDINVFVFTPFLKYNSENFDVTLIDSVKFFLNYAGKVFKYKATLLDSVDNDLICSNVEKIKKSS